MPEDDECCSKCKILNPSNICPVKAVEGATADGKDQKLQNKSQKKFGYKSTLITKEFVSFIKFVE